MVTLDAEDLHVIFMRVDFMRVVLATRQKPAPVRSCVRSVCNLAV